MNRLFSVIDAFLSELFEERVESYESAYNKFEKEHFQAQEIREIASLLKELDQ